MNTPYFRAFRPTDSEQCAYLALQAWPMIAPRRSSHQALMQLYVDVSRLGTTWCEVACVEETVVGLFFARLRADITWDTRFTILTDLMRIGIRYGVGRYGAIAKPLKLLSAFLATELKVSAYTVGAMGEVTLFVVDQHYRGHGIGKQLLNRFLQYAQQRRVNRVTLYTDPLSNWQFYERYGFRRCGEFADNLNSSIQRTALPGFVYCLDLPHASIP